MTQPHFRTIWISDIHLGTPACKADALCAFLKSHTCDKLYLVGDVIDGWALKNRWYWPSTHSQVVRQILKKAEKQGTEVIYITGNHDDFLREHTKDNNISFGSIKVINEDVHNALSGKKYWVIHGDHYDAVLKHYKVIEKLGDFGYALIMWINQQYDIIRRKNNLPKFSFIRFMKNKIHLIGEFAEKFERAISQATSQRGYDGVICGHIHRAGHHNKYNVDFWNDGDWVENCSTVVEHLDGRMEVMEWIEDYLDDNKQAVFVLKSQKSQAI